jgi:ribosomal protein L37AE/L43A
MNQYICPVNNLKFNPETREIKRAIDSNFRNIQTIDPQGDKYNWDAKEVVNDYIVKPFVSSQLLKNPSSEVKKTFNNLKSEKEFKSFNSLPTYYQISEREIDKGKNDAKKRVQEVYDYEYDNHECSITCDDSEAIMIALGIFTEAECKTIKRKNGYLNMSIDDLIASMKKEMA